MVTHLRPQEPESTMTIPTAMDRFVKIEGYPFCCILHEEVEVSRADEAFFVSFYRCS